jgi:hypothetical protein
MYDVNKKKYIQKLKNDYRRSHFIEFGIYMVKPLNIVKFNIVDRNNQNIVKTTKYDNMTDEELLNELNINRKRMLLTCKIYQSFTSVMDKKPLIPFCDYEWHA